MRGERRGAEQAGAWFEVMVCGGGHSLVEGKRRRWHCQTSEGASVRIVAPPTLMLSAISEKFVAVDERN
jgi:hypothetical protein